MRPWCCCDLKLQTINTAFSRLVGAPIPPSLPSKGLRPTSCPCNVEGCPLSPWLGLYLMPIVTLSRLHRLLLKHRVRLRHRGVLCLYFVDDIFINLKLLAVLCSALYFDVVPVATGRH
eukprot:scaffold265870_cov30-Tisochrysis_lutea.AAC.1